MKTLRTTWPLIASVLLLLVMFRLFVPAFLSSSNLLDLTQQISVNAILAFGMTLVILSGGIDLSVGALLALTGTDPDRLPEEKARGITIDLGFAHLELTSNIPTPTTYHLGIVDVPGLDNLQRQDLRRALVDRRGV